MATDPIIGPLHRGPESTNLYPTNHCVDRFRTRIAPHLGGRDTREIRHLILREIEQGQPATPEQLDLIRQSRARMARSLDGHRKFGNDQIVINNYVAYVTENNEAYGPLVVTCYECDYLRVLERPASAAQPRRERDDEWPWEWTETPEQLLARDPYVDLLAAYRGGDSVFCAGYYVNLSGEPGAIVYRPASSKKKWQPVDKVPRAQFEIRASDETVRAIHRRDRKRVELERRMQHQQNADYQKRRTG